jgi:hypothetical protein
MITLTGQEILRIWEIGAIQHPVDRALTILSAAFPQSSRDELLALTVGQRDARLLNVRKKTFGTQFASFARCPFCREQLEFVLDVADIQVTSDSGECTNQAHHMIDEEYELHFRLPDSRDLAAIAVMPDVATACKLLVDRCVLKAIRQGLEIEVENLPDTMITALAAQMEERDPQAEVQIDLKCSACEHHWLVIFDIATFLWAEISVQARRLMRDVHALAWAYSWREADILSLSAARRQVYLEMVT